VPGQEERASPPPLKVMIADSVAGPGENGASYQHRQQLQHPRDEREREEGKMNEGNRLCSTWPMNTVSKPFFFLVPFPFY